jgi:hypothetical protein
MPIGARLEEFDIVVLALGAAGDTEQPCGGRWSRAGALRNATIMARSGPQPQQRTAEPAAYLTALSKRNGAIVGAAALPNHTPNGLAGVDARPVDPRGRRLRCTSRHSWLTVP